MKNAGILRVALLLKIVVGTTYLQQRFFTFGKHGLQYPCLDLFSGAISKKMTLGLHDFAGKFYLTCFDNCKTIEIDLCNAVNFP